MMSSPASFSPLPTPPADYVARAQRHPEETLLVAIGRDVFGREQRLSPGAAAAWTAMAAAAAEDGVRLLLISGFRSVARQREIVERKLARGLTWEEILRVSAYPGFSEHHTGCAVDVGSPACAHLTESFAATPEFAWLRRRAAAFGFTLSYPAGEDRGVAYEPWHWRWRPCAGC